MIKISKIKLVGGAFVVVLLIVVAMLTTSAMAAPPTPSQPGNSNTGNPGYGMMGGYNLSGVAKLLGVSKQVLISQLQGGKTLVQIAQGKATEEQLVNTLLAPIKDELQLRVKYEFITQEKADAYLKQITDRVRTSINASSNAQDEGAGGCGGSAGTTGGAGMMGGTSGMMGGSGGMMGGNYNGHNGMMGGSL